MKNILFITVFFLMTSFLTDKSAYKLYTKTGKEVKYSKMLEDIQEADIILFGEIHNNPISHWLEFELTKDLFEIKQQNLILGAEMFESDNQLIIDEYFAGLITKKKFEEEVRLWSNYSTDYKPFFEFAKTNELRFIATNIPRRYANTVFKQGIETLDKLSEEAKKYIAPLPIEIDLELACYKNLIQGMEGMGMHGNENIAYAQAVKDATMAYFILQNHENGQLFIHFHGAYHSENYESIYYYLKKANPDLKIATITTVSQADISKLNEEHQNTADYIICVAETMTGTY